MIVHHGHGRDAAAGDMMALNEAMDRATAILGGAGQCPDPGPMECGGIQSRARKSRLNPAM